MSYLFGGAIPPPNKDGTFGVDSIGTPADASTLPPPVASTPSGLDGAPIGSTGATGSTGAIAPPADLSTPATPTTTAPPATPLTIDVKTDIPPAAIVGIVAISISMIGVMVYVITSIKPSPPIR
jgi:hypothetical protein